MESSVAVDKGGFTLVEILIVVAIITVMAAILFPALSRVREQGNVTVCRSNLRQIGLAIQQYADDNSRYPYWLTVTSPSYGSTSNGPGWAYRIRPYVGSLQLFRCPSAGPIFGGKEAVIETDGLEQYNAVHYTDYALNIHASGVEEGRIKAPSSFILIQEIRSPAPTNSSAFTNGSFPTIPGHFGQFDNLFADGHVKLIARDNTFAYCTNEGTTIPGFDTRGLPTFCID